MPEPGPTHEKAQSDAEYADSQRESVESAPGRNDEPGPKRPREIGGREGLDPTRYGDWEYKGRCIDF